MKKGAIRFVTVFSLLGIMVWMFVDKDRSFSDKENRILAQLPKVSVASITNGEFMDEWETYLSDQFPLRDWCVALRSNTVSLFGQKKINGVYLAKDNYLIPVDDDASQKVIDPKIEAINSLAERYPLVNLEMLLVPGAACIYEDKLPYGIKTTQNDTIEYVSKNLNRKITFIGVKDSLVKNSDKQLYYRTDHHWTTRGAFVAFSQFGATHMNNVVENDYEFMEVSRNFYGTQASNSGIYKKGDTVEICVPRNSEGTYTVTYVEEGEKRSTFFDLDKLNEKDKYLVFMGGNYAQISISTSANNGRKLLIIKDSYANCMIPMFAKYYEQIEVIDPRYCTDSIDDIIVGNEIKEVLFLYSVNGFATDSALTGIIASEDME